MPNITDDPTRRVTVPAGTYWAGDPGYAAGITDTEWIDWLNRCYGHRDTVTVLDKPMRGQFFLGISTAYGDGCYHGSDGNEYPVDAGLIGLVPVTLSPEGSPLMTRVTFTEAVEAYTDNGTIHLGHITIPTGDDDEDGDTVECAECTNRVDPAYQLCSDCQMEQDAIDAETEDDE